MINEGVNVKLLHELLTDCLNSVCDELNTCILLN